MESLVYKMKTARSGEEEIHFTMRTNRQNVVARSLATQPCPIRK